MTPLARMVLEENRKGEMERKILRELRLTKCFEVTEILKAVDNIAVPFNDAIKRDESLMGLFLPFERVALEWRIDGQRNLLMFYPGQDGESVVVLITLPPKQRKWIGHHIGSINIAGNRVGPLLYNQHVHDVEFAKKLIGQGLATFCIINQPKLTIEIQRSTREPRLIVNSERGHWPMYAHHEVRLACGAPEEHRAGHPTGRVMPQHEVRAHWQRYGGVWRLIASYVRGDPRKGMRRARYRCVPPSDGTELRP